MAGGQLQIAIPVSWNVTKKMVTVTDSSNITEDDDADATTATEDQIIYTTDADGVVIAEADATTAAPDYSQAPGRVTLSLCQVLRW